MMQAVCHNFPNAEVEYTFKCRNSHIDLRPYTEKIFDEIHSCSFGFFDYELDYLSGFDFFKKDFIDFLSSFRLDPDKYVDISCKNGFELKIKGPWKHTILFEVPILAIISEVYNRQFINSGIYKRGESELIKNIKEYVVPGMFITDFGTRRRFNNLWQERIIEILMEECPDNFVGTSNVYFAREHKIKPIGTMAHEWLQAFQALSPLRTFQKSALDVWVREYRGDLGIALTDVIGVDPFLKDFDKYFCKLYDGVRHDSGNPFIWCEKVIKHYEKMGIDPRTKLAIFSDRLTFKSARELYNCLHNRINVSFGIGTHLTNNLGVDSLNIVIKMTKCNGQPVAKLSDSPGKGMCENETYLAWLKEMFDIK